MFACEIDAVDLHGAAAAYVFGGRLATFTGLWTLCSGREEEVSQPFTGSGENPILIGLDVIDGYFDC